MIVTTLMRPGCAGWWACRCVPWGRIWMPSMRRWRPGSGCTGPTCAAWRSWPGAARCPRVRWPSRRVEHVGGDQCDRPGGTVRELAPASDPRDRRRVLVEVTELGASGGGWRSADCRRVPISSCAGTRPGSCGCSASCWRRSGPWLPGKPPRRRRLRSRLVGRDRPGGPGDDRLLAAGARAELP